MDDKFDITLKFDNKEYPLKGILREEEENYRKAAKLIDYKLRQYRSLYPKFDADTHWAMVATDLAYKMEWWKEQNDTRPYFEKLDELGKKLEQCIRSSESGSEGG